MHLSELIISGLAGPQASAFCERHGSLGEIDEQGGTVRGRDGGSTLGSSRCMAVRKICSLRQLKSCVEREAARLKHRDIKRSRVAS